MSFRLLTCVVATASVVIGNEAVVGQCVDPPAGMVAWWSGDATTGDLAGSHNGTLIGDATYADGMVGQAFLLDGDGDWVSVPDDPDWDLGGDFTIDFWVRLDVIKDTMFIEHVPNGFEFDYQVGSQNLIFARNSSTAAVFQSWLPQPDTWYFLAVTRTGGFYQLFVDGNPLGAAIANPAPDFEDGDLVIGGHPGNPSFELDGRIDEVEIFHEALSPGEILALFNAGAAGKCKTAAVPAVSTWGLAVLLMLTMAIATISFRIRAREI